MFDAIGDIDIALIARGHPLRHPDAALAQYRELVAFAHDCGWHVAVVTSSFHELVAPVLGELAGAGAASRESGRRGGTCGGEVRSCPCGHSAYQRGASGSKISPPH